MRACADRSRCPRRTLLLATIAAITGAGRASATAPASASLPAYREPAAYSETLVITSGGSQLEMKRFVGHGKIRTELSGAGADVVMIELGDERGTSYTLVPAQKMAIKQLRPPDEAPASDLPQRSGDGEGAPLPAGVQLEDLGTERIGEVSAKKLRITAPDGVALAWFDPASGAPLRMETSAGGEKGTLAWKGRRVEPQPARLFEVPGEYQVIDVEQMQGAAGKIGAAGIRMAADSAGQTVRRLGSSLGESAGGSLGMALGGPLGAVVGRYVGGRVGGMLADKVTGTIVREATER